VLTREAVHAEGIPGGFSAVYDVLKAMEEAGRVRRGYFVAGLGATQFALPGAEDRLRALREPPDPPEVAVLAATDPASPYGAALAWPERSDVDRRPEQSEGSVAPVADAKPQRAAGALVILVGGAAAAHLGRTDRSLLTFLPEDEPARGRTLAAVAGALAALVDQGRRRTLLLSRIDGADPARSPLAPHLAAAGFTATSRGYFKRAATAASAGARR
jgi:ATP-dependent Lhr-like helicase